MKALLILGRVFGFIVLTTIIIEYLVNRQSSTVLSLLAVVLVILSGYILVYPLIKKLFRS